MDTQRGLRSVTGVSSIMLGVGAVLHFFFGTAPVSTLIIGLILAGASGMILLGEPRNAERKESGTKNLTTGGKVALRLSLLLVFLFVLGLAGDSSAVVISALVVESALALLVLLGGRSWAALVRR